MNSPPTEEICMYQDKLRLAAQTYFKSFGRLFGETPNFPSGEERMAALKTIENLVISTYNEFADDPAVNRIVDIAVLDKMEELINAYK